MIIYKVTVCESIHYLVCTHMSTHIYNNECLIYVCEFAPWSYQ